MSGFHDNGTNEWSPLTVRSFEEGCVVGVVETGAVSDLAAVTIEVSCEGHIGPFEGAFKIGERLNGLQLSLPCLLSSSV